MNIVLLPILLPFLGAIVCLFFKGNIRAQRIVAGIVSSLLPVIGFYLLLRVRHEGVMALRLGSWPDAYGIVLTLDLLGAIMLCLAGLTQAASWWFVAAGSVSATVAGSSVPSGSESAPEPLSAKGSTTPGVPVARPVTRSSSATGGWAS